MTNKRAVEKAIQLLRPVQASLEKRCPAGMTKGVTDVTQGRIASSLVHLVQALASFEIAEERRAS